MNNRTSQDCLTILAEVMESIHDELGCTAAYDGRAVERHPGYYTVDLMVSNFALAEFTRNHVTQSLDEISKRNFAQAREDIENAADPFMWRITAAVSFYDGSSGPACRFTLSISGDYPHYLRDADAYTVFAKCFDFDTLEVDNRLGDVSNAMLAAFFGHSPAVARREG